MCSTSTIIKSSRKNTWITKHCTEQVFRSFPSTVKCVKPIIYRDHMSVTVSLNKQIRWKNFQYLQCSDVDPALSSRMNKSVPGFIFAQFKSPVWVFLKEPLQSPSCFPQQNEGCRYQFSCWHQDKGLYYYTASADRQINVLIDTSNRFRVHRKESDGGLANTAGDLPRSS